jgi:hypothetical protein
MSHLTATARVSRAQVYLSDRLALSHKSRRLTPAVARRYVLAQDGS